MGVYVSNQQNLLLLMFPGGKQGFEKHCFLSSEKPESQIKTTLHCMIKLGILFFSLDMVFEVPRNT